MAVMNEEMIGREGKAQMKLGKGRDREKCTKQGRAWNKYRKRSECKGRENSEAREEMIV